jgi:hypothetical protein
VQFDAKKYQLTNNLDIAAEVARQDAAQQAQTAVESSRASTAIDVMRATYGYGEKLVDVTNEIRGRVRAGQMSIRASNDLAGDPAFGNVKSLTIQYSIGGGTPLVATAREGESISLGQPSGHHETARQKQEVSRRPVQTMASARRNPLERGAYNRTQDTKYTDSSGRRYWKDIRGRPHYDE